MRWKLIRSISVVSFFSGRWMLRRVVLHILCGSGVHLNTVHATLSTARCDFLKRRAGEVASYVKKRAEFRNIYFPATTPITAQLQIYRQFTTTVIWLLDREKSGVRDWRCFKKGMITECARKVDLRLNWRRKREKISIGDIAKIRR
jgi:hypothetical protein